MIVHISNFKEYLVQNKIETVANLFNNKGGKVEINSKLFNIAGGLFFLDYLI